MRYACLQKRHHVWSFDLALEERKTVCASGCYTVHIKCMFFCVKGNLGLGGVCRENKIYNKMNSNPRVEGFFLF